MSHEQTPPEPRLERRAEQPYIAIAAAGKGPDAFRAAVDAAFPALFDWLSEHGVTPAGPPFISYLVSEPDAEGPWEIELGVPLAVAVAGDERVRAGVLPAGSYAVHLHVGAYRATTPAWEGRDLAAAHALMETWAARAGVVWATAETDRGLVARARLERYLVDPLSTPDPAEWQTELAFLVRD